MRLSLLGLVILLVCLVIWKNEPEITASGDPHINSLWGCSFDASRNETEAVLMSCEGGELRIRYDKDWDFHIYQVLTVIDGVRDRYHHKFLKHPQTKTICGNVVQFHRYHAGINIKVLSMKNHAIGGLFNDTRCIGSYQDVLHGE